MCFGSKGSGTPTYVKKDYGALPSLGTGSATQTVTLNEAPPVAARGSRAGSSSYEANSPINISTGGGSSSYNNPVGLQTSLTPPTNPMLNPTPNLNYTPPSSTLLRRAYLNVTSPFLRG